MMVEAIKKALEDLDALVTIVAEDTGALVMSDPDEESVGSTLEGDLEMTFGHVRRAHQALSTLESLQRENEGLRAALKPFADYMGDHGDKDNLGNPLPGDQDVAWVYLTYSDFRRARAALSSTGDTHGN